MQFIKQSFNEIGLFFNKIAFHLTSYLRGFSTLYDFVQFYTFANSSEVLAIMNDKISTIYYFIRVYLIFLMSAIEDIRKQSFISCSTPNGLFVGF